MNKLFSTTFCLVLFLGCGKNNNINPDPIPELPVNITINLALKAPFLNVPGSFFYEQGGFKGLIIVNDFDGEIKVFDRTCSYEPRTTCSNLWVDSLSLQLKCGGYDSANSFISCCSSRFDFNGNVTNEPATFPIKRYRTSKSGSLLNIFN